MGKITEVVQKYVPASYHALCAVTNEFYSLALLQDLAEFVQYRLFATVATESDEATAYNLKQRELLGILTTLQFIPAAIDYWGNVVASQAASGVNENQSYYDRRTDLWKVYAQLQAEAAELSTELGVFSKAIHLPQVSYGDNGRNVLLTPDPQKWPKAFRTHHGSRVPWTPWGG